MKEVRTIIGLEYICGLYNKKYTNVAEELGVSRQVVSVWIKGTKPIAKKHLPKLSKMFNLPEEYFQRQITELDKLDIQKIKLHNEKTEFEYEDTITDPDTGEEITITRTYIEEADMFNDAYIDYEKNIINLTNRIKELIHDRFNDEYDDTCGLPYNALSEASNILNLYEKLTKIIKHGGIFNNIINDVFDGMLNYQHDFMGRSKNQNRFTKKVTKLIEQEQDRQIEEAKLWVTDDDETDDLL
ncbi:transcriptional regulator with XRE-family HTH domain [Clostridium beijerinckii]|nr:helix-turn-helix domain-containing protein [Clostridium beijerinckii]NRT34115.1 transcriptional regulator with XRE-family HTH domain [Clostridium beijerinckii]NRT46456.1 transcriptional regulator with XRE-family HTH domain [Clostridium beijerinckii]NRZ19540.1 transcriptional regulator with XRE-family HTH domain [Clostridium beijerinckii]